MSTPVVREAPKIFVAVEPPTQTRSAIRPRWVVLGLPIGRPQFVAAALLLLLLIQALWFALHAPLSEMERSYIRQGRAQLISGSVPNSSSRAPLPGVLTAILLPTAAADALTSGGNDPAVLGALRLLARLPSLFAGMMLGVSLWYVSRRLYGNVGGYTALALYCFTPDIVIRSATVQPAIIAAWGAFGMVFTAIAVAHTLYAPREVILWNWRRILLLGLSVALAVGSQPGLVLMVAVAAALLLYLAPERRAAALGILAAACIFALALLWAIYSFSFTALFSGIAQISTADFRPAALTSRLTYSLVTLFLLRTPALLVLLLGSLGIFSGWRRARFFGTAAPLLVFALLLLLGIVLPQQGGYGFFLVAIPFACVFAAGVSADVLESQAAPLGLGMLIAVLASHAIFSLIGLVRM